MTAETLLFALIRAAFFGTPVAEQAKAACTPEMLEELYPLAKSHDVAHLVGKALDGLGLPESPTLTKFRNKMLQAVYRYARQDYEYQQVCASLEAAQIPYLPLKGTVLRPHYPEAWMRTSCDTDILIHKEDLARAKAVILNDLHFTERRTSPHDVSLISPTKELLELHFAIIEDFVSPKAREILDRVWEYVTPAADSAYRYEMPDDLFYYYHIVHMAKHVENGGCSIRFFLDTWILNHRVPHDPAKREALLTDGGRLTFDRSARKLAEIWFGDEEEDTPSHYFARYILRGGNFGNMTNRVAIRQSKEGGKWRYMMKRVILPYDLIKYYFPILQKRKWLTPWYQIVRWWNLLTRGNVRHSIGEVKINTFYDNSDTIPTDVLIRYLGLKE